MTIEIKGLQKKYFYKCQKKIFGVSLPWSRNVEIFSSNHCVQGSPQNLFLDELSLNYKKRIDWEYSKVCDIKFRIGTPYIQRPCLMLNFYELQFFNGEKENLLYVRDRVIENPKLRNCRFGDFLLDIAEEIAISNHCTYTWSWLSPTEKIGGDMEKLKSSYIRRGYSPVEELFPGEKRNAQVIFAKHL